MGIMVEYIGTCAAARLLGVTPKTINRWGNDGRLSFVLTSENGHRRYVRDDIIRMRNSK